MTQQFIEFWQCYPKKIGKGAVEAKYKKIDAETHTAIILAIDAQKRMRREMDKAKQFCPPWPNPLTWVNQRRWEDEFETSHAELKEKQKAQVCGMDGCNGEATATGRCLDCEAQVPDWKTDMLRQRWQDLGIKKAPDYKTPCLQAMYKMNPALARLIGRG